MGKSRKNIWPISSIRAPIDKELANVLRIILETDAAAIAARVSRPKADTTEIVINEQTIMSACTYLSCLPMLFLVWTASQRALDTACRLGLG